MCDRKAKFKFRLELLCSISHKWHWEWHESFPQPMVVVLVTPYHKIYPLLKPQPHGLVGWGCSPIIHIPPTLFCFYINFFILSLFFSFHFLYHFHLNFSFYFYFFHSSSSSFFLIFPLISPPSPSCHISFSLSLIFTLFHSTCFLK